MRAFVIGTMVIASFVPGTGQAQNVSVGVKGGFVSSTIDVQGFEALESDAGAGGAVGGFLEFGGDKMLSFRPEVLLTWRRFRLSDQLGTEVESGARSVDLPLLLVLRTANAQRVKGVVFAGPQFTFINDVWQEFEGERSDIDDNIKDAETAVAFGGGIEVPAGRGAWLVDARFIIGLRNLSEQPAATIKSRAFAALVGYRF